MSFGAVQTDGMISMREDHGQWVLRPFPRSRDFTVLLQDSKFVMPASVTADGAAVLCSNLLPKELIGSFLLLEPSPTPGRPGRVAMTSGHEHAFQPWEWGPIEYFTG